MPHKLIWTAPSDARLRRLRAEGHRWDHIAAELGISRNAAIERGRRLGARLPPPEHKPEPEDPDRAAFAPGHWVSWGAITAGTSLENEPYVYEPPRLRRGPTCRGEMDGIRLRENWKPESAAGELENKS